MRLAIPCLLLLAAAGCRQVPAADPPPSAAVNPLENADMTIAPDVQKRLARFAPTDVSADLSALSPADLQVLALLVEAARPMDDIFLRQVWTGNPDLAARLAKVEGPLAEAARGYFDLNFGPWDRLDAFAPFVGQRPHPQGAGYYPADLTKQELESWLAAHPADHDALTSLTTVVERREGGLAGVPYSQVYRQWLEPAAARLREAAALTGNASLKRFLELRADAFLSDDYYASDLAWMDLDAPVEVTIGPYETYEDGLFGYKAAYEAFVTVALPSESRALERYKADLPWLERNLPIPDEHKNLHRGTDSPIRVVDEVFTSGEARSGIQTLAYNLPNDERVREAKGSKKVLLRNVMRAKYDRILLPIAERTLAKDQLGGVAFDAYFNEVLHHELSHGLGPGKIEVGGRDTEVRLELKELYSTLEEAKADVMGVYDILALIERGEMPAALRGTLEPTYVAGLFRAARFGVSEAHGQGVVAQFNYLMAKGAVAVDAEGRFRSIPEKFPGAIRDLLHDMLMLQATGDYAGTRAFLDRYGKPTPELTAAIDRLDEVPVDVKPNYVDVARLPAVSPR